MHWGKFIVVGIIVSPHLIYISFCWCMCSLFMAIVTLLMSFYDFALRFALTYQSLWLIGEIFIPFSIAWNMIFWWVTPSLVIIFYKCEASPEGSQLVALQVCNIVIIYICLWWSGCAHKWACFDILYHYFPYVQCSWRPNNYCQVIMGLGRMQQTCLWRSIFVNKNWWTIGE